MDMIKRILPFFVLFLLVAIFGCKEQPIPTYEDLTSDRYIYFGRSEKDSIEVSFLFYPGQKVIDTSNESFSLLPKYMYLSDVRSSYVGIEMCIRDRI